MADCDIVVVGAGISGLVAAYRLVRGGFDVQVIEAASRAGGVIGTNTAQGILYERGPNSIMDTSPRIDELLQDLGIRAERIGVNPLSAKRFILRDGLLRALPTTPPAFLSTSLFSRSAKLRALAEPFVARAPAGTEESVAQFVERRLGHEFLEYAIEPFVAGIYAGEPARLSLEAAFPRLHALERRYGSLIKGQLLGVRRRAHRSKPVAKSFSFRKGLQTLTDALAAALPTLRLDTALTALHRDNDGRFAITAQNARGEMRQTARAVVLAIPADSAARLIGDSVPDAAAALLEIPYAPVASVTTAYRRRDIAHPLDGFGFLAPRREQRRILGTLFSSTMFDGRCAKDEAVLTTYLGGERTPQLVSLSETELSEIVHEELTSLLGARARPLFAAVSRWPRAIPQYNLGHLERIRRARRAESELPGLFLCGAYRGGVAVGDCISTAHDTADAVAGYLDPDAARAAG
jgi:oxygen-dependent protoporphyrinogen oxidase